MISILRPPQRQALVISAAAVMAIAGCGNSSSLTAAQLASRGSSICQRATAEERAIHATSLPLALPRITSIGDNELARLRKLSPPASERSAYAGLLSDFSQITNLLTPLSSALASTGKAPPQLLRRGRELAHEAEALATPLGLASCSQAAARA
jgi:hypothetical protein